jgi:formylglycine-generating enzyme required for sulfatase activity
MIDDDEVTQDEFRQSVGDPEDVWHETPGGHCKMQIDLDQDIVGELVTMYVESNLDPASIELYHEAREASDPANHPVEALWEAVVNAQIVNALKAKIEDAENEAKDV